MNFESRNQALAEMARQLGEDSFSAGLVDAYMKDTHFLKKDIYYREVFSPAKLLRDVGRETVYSKSFNIDFDALRPLGKVAVLLPKNSINLSVCKAVSASFLAGNKTLVRLPGKLTNSLPWFKQLVENHLPGVNFVASDMSSEVFLKECIASRDI